MLSSARGQREGERQRGAFEVEKSLDDISILACATPKLFRLRIARGTSSTTPNPAPSRRSRSIPTPNSSIDRISLRHGRRVPQAHSAGAANNPPHERSSAQREGTVLGPIAGQTIGMRFGDGFLSCMSALMELCRSIAAPAGSRDCPLRPRLPLPDRLQLCFRLFKC